MRYLIILLLLLPNIPIQHQDSYEEKIDLLIITPKQFKDELKEFAEYKTKNGIETKVLSLEDDIYVHKYFPVEGRDEQEIIKYFIKNAKERWNIDYVLLIGDSDVFPVRYAYIDEDYYPTDLYYGDIYSHGDFSTWDKNGNSKFGEWLGANGEGELYPEIAVSRLPVGNLDELRTIVKKIIEYETNTDKEWFYNFVIGATDTFQSSDTLSEPYEGEELGNYI
ncbi:MAG: C25 family cysteine peptidase, partial [Candidatus Thermoplasmatota archaeon]